jgi:hypothetical protein
MANIQKPDANPIVAALLTWFVFGLGHLIVNGQQRKWMYSLIVTIIGSFLCILPGIVIGILSVVDAYQTAERLQKGETIEENEYTFEPMFKVVKMIDSTATCKTV